MLRTFIPGFEHSRLFRPLRSAYLRTFKPAYWERHSAYTRKLREFYEPFVPAGSLVFDIGANIGEYSEAFLDLGARVIAVEPNPDLVRKLLLIRNRRLTVVQCAAGDQEGKLPLHINSHVNTLGSLSDEWINTALRLNLFPPGMGTWDRTVTVPVQTLDSLIERYGMPHFIKIDVEGFELPALRGLTKMPQFLSFEFNRTWTAPTFECLKQPCFPDGAKFNYVIENRCQLVLPQWVSAAEMSRVVNAATCESFTYADILVRR
jgi:FkbM family methyltransferase